MSIQTASDSPPPGTIYPPASESRAAGRATSPSVLTDLDAEEAQLRKRPSGDPIINVVLSILVVATAILFYLLHRYEISGAPEQLTTAPSPAAPGSFAALPAPMPLSVPAAAPAVSPAPAVSAPPTVEPAPSRSAEASEEEARSVQQKKERHRKPAEPAPKSEADKDEELHHLPRLTVPITP